MDGETVVEVDDSSSEEEGGVYTGYPPRRFRNYRRGRELGRGASGRVFVCRRDGCGTGFAVKAVDLKRLQLSADVDRRRKLLAREVDILKALPPHQSIVHMVDAFQEGDYFLLILELVGGGDLFTALTSRVPNRFFAREAVFVLIQLSDALDFLHNHSVIHRDLKLENILVISERREGPFVLYTVKITDFGLSKSIGEDASTAVSIVGTRQYAAPEVVRGDPQSCNSDLWCLGVLLFVLLVGKFPFEEDSCSCRIPSVQSEINNRIAAKMKTSSALTSIVSGLLELQPDQRLSPKAICKKLGYEGCEGDPKERHIKFRKYFPSLNELATKVAFDLDTEELATQAEPDSKKRRLLLVSNSQSTPIGQTDRGFNGQLKREVQDEHGVSAQLQNKTKVGLLGSSPWPTPCLRDWLACIFPVGLDEQANNTTLDSPFGPSQRPAASATELAKVCPQRPKLGEIQVYMVVENDLLQTLAGKAGVQIKQIANTIGCNIRTVKSERTSLISIMGSYNECVLAQEIFHARLKDGTNGRTDVQAEVVLLVRVEAAGVVVGKNEFMLNKIRNKTGARIALPLYQTKGHRPCILTGALQSILHAEKHIFHLTRAVAVATPTDGDSEYPPFSPYSPFPITPAPSPLTPQ